MQLTVQTAIFTLLAIILLSACAERYTMFGPTKVYEGIIDNKNAHRKFHSLDTPWNVDRLSNDRKQQKIHLTCVRLNRMGIVRKLTCHT